MINERQKPYTTSQEEQDLRWKKYCGEITDEEYAQQYNELKKQGKIIRSGRVVKDE